MALSRKLTHFLVPLIANILDGFKRSVAGGVTGVFTDPNHGHTLTDPTHSHAVVTRRVFTLGVLAAAGVNYVPQYAAGAAIDDAVGPFVQFVPARTVQVSVGPGVSPTCVVTIDGTDDDGNALQELIPTPAPGTVQGTRAFRTITRVRTNEDPLDTVDVETGHGFGLGPGVATIHAVSVDGVVSAPTSTHVGTGTVVPTPVPNGARVYAAEVSFTQTSAAAATGATVATGSTGISFTAATPVVHHDRDERVITAANASDLATSLTLTKALCVTYAAHRVDTLHHQAADTTNTVASGYADVVDLPTAIIAANQLKTAYNAHRSQAGVHWSNDAGNAIAAADATDQSSLNTLLNELKADINLHFGTGMELPVSWRVG